MAYAVLKQIAAYSDIHTYNSGDAVMFPDAVIDFGDRLETSSQNVFVKLYPFL